MLSDEQISRIQSLYSDLLNYSSKEVFQRIDPLSYETPEGDTLLHIAAMRGDVETMALLLKAGMDLNATGDMGNTPLHYACDQPNKEAVRMLIENGARTDIRNEFGNYPSI